MEYGLPPPRRVESRRDREMVKKQVDTRRRLLQVMTGTFPCGQQLLKYGYTKKADCTLCKKSA
jgi:hypothetical protein